MYIIVLKVRLAWLAVAHQIWHAQLLMQFALISAQQNRNSTDATD